MSEVKKAVLAYSGGLDTSIITPWREWDIQSRDEEIDYAEAHGQAHRPPTRSASWPSPSVSWSMTASGSAPLRKALSAFVTSTQETVTGKVRLELYKGNLINAGVWSPYSLYREDIATFAAGGDYKQSDATGFISIYGLPTKVQAIVNKEKEGK